MTRLNYSSMLTVLLFLSVSTLLSAQNWPQWRGPQGDGTSTESNLPIKWDDKTNVIWRTEVPGVGHSSPVVWENRLFTLTAIPEKNEKILLCFDSQSGKLLWQSIIVKSEFEDKHDDNSYASGTPATNGKLVFVSVLDGEDVVVAAFDFDGQKVWEQRPGKFLSPHGYSCSPALYNDKIIINGESKGTEPFIAALNQSDGKIVWKVVHNNQAHSFSTPIFRTMEGKMQMIFGGNKQVASYNPDNGFRYWFVNGPSEDFCSSPVYNEKSGLVLISSAWPQRHLLAIKPDGIGDVTETKVVWRTTTGAYYVPSPVCTPDFLFTTMTNGKVYCIEIATGEIIWEQNMGKQYSSGVFAGGLVYMPNDEGVITVIKPGPTPEIISKNAIGERMNASPAISNGKIFLRGDKHIFCIGNI